jgi:hypothetical protein
MISLPKPTNEDGSLIDPGEVYDICISRVRNPGLRARLRSIRHLVIAAADDYAVRAGSVDLHLVSTSNSVGGVVDKDEMMVVYDNRFVPEKSPGRAKYIRIKDAAPNDRCPLCQVGTVTTLDHHLPKAKYPTLVVTPNNLVPACTWCQGAKKSDSPKSKEEQTFHPYFDDFNDKIWLTAQVVEGVPAVFKFNFSAPKGWKSIKAKRGEQHFKTFEVAKLLTSNAAHQLTGIRSSLTNLFNDGGAHAVRAKLEEDEGSWRSSNLNSWEAAFYQAAAESDWFCEGGFLGK